ncbi:MAG: FAD-dependent oxidoreductase [Deltaproteobacteria bacterium]|nr:FAD-dependent oxidoreductase [Deltaproteobacteria bacterium]
MTIPYDLIILGAGPAGLTAGIYAGRAKIKTLILGADPGGNPLRYELIGNYPGFPQGVPGAQLMTGMIMQVNLLGVEMVHQNAVKISFLERGQKIFTDGEEYASNALIVASGSSPIKMDVPGEKEFRGQGIYYCAHCDAPVFQAMNKSKAAVIGGGNSALHTALHVTRYADEVTVIYRGTKLRAEQPVQEAALANPKIRIMLDQEVEAVQGENQQVHSLMLKDRKTGRQTKFPTDGVFVGIGMKPNSELFDGLLALNAEGFIRVNLQMETSVPGVFAAGDVIDKTLRQIITAAGDGAVAADSAQKYLETNLSG